jgi:hypothetical protein
LKLLQTPYGAVGLALLRGLRPSPVRICSASRTV